MIGSSTIRHVKLNHRKQSLGILRNIALDHAHGEYICQWDDDDLYDPLRLKVQLQTIYSTKAQASVLARWMIWWPNLNQLSISCYRDCEGSLLCERSLMPRYPDISKGEDSIIMEKLRHSIRIARIGMPRLYIYIFHGPVMLPEVAGSGRVVPELAGSGMMARELDGPCRIGGIPPT